MKEEELKKEEERKKAENRNTPEREKKKSKSSGASGTNTPSGRPSKHADPLKQSSSGNNLKKRAGSPLNSEASGNESSRKKQKKKHPLTTAQIQTSSTLQAPPSRPGSPPIPTGKDLKAPAKRRHGSGSDTEGNAGSGGDMSDGTRKKKLKLTMSSKNGSPRGSRAGSPDLVNGTKPAQGTSRAASPGTLLLSFLQAHNPPRPYLKTISIIPLFFPNNNTQRSQNLANIPSLPTQVPPPHHHPPPHPPTPNPNRKRPPSPPARKSAPRFPPPASRSASSSPASKAPSRRRSRRRASRR